MTTTLRLGDTAPEFTQESTAGPLHFHAWAGDSTFTYPASTGRNFAEILRVIDSLQLTDGYKVATPANWQDGGDVIVVPSLQDPVELAQRFPKGFTVVRPCLRTTPQPNQSIRLSTFFTTCLPPEKRPDRRLCA
jgi:hypothetical protein